MFCKLKFLLLLIIILINIKYLKGFNVNFNYNYNLQVEPFNTQIYKRESTQFFDQASFSFNGLEKVESIPVTFPIDICVFSLEGFKYATALHLKRNGAKHFKVMKVYNGSYELIADIPSAKGIAMDCLNFNNKGYVAVALNITEPLQHAREGSPIYEISGQRIRAVQYFATPNLTSVYLRASGNDFFLLQTYTNSKNAVNLHCPYFKWSGSAFNKIGRIPCSNARQLTPFLIDYESYVAVANYADQRGRTSINSEIYKYSRDKNKFVLFQKIATHGAVDVQYFNVPQLEVIRHFLVFGNSISRAYSAKGKNSHVGGHNLEADSVLFLYDKGKFIPHQKLSLYAVKKFLPVQNIEAEKFILLVDCNDQDIKIYNFNDGKFEESKVQFTEGALGKGVSNMRLYQENEKSYLIIANKLMGENETNMFLPIFKQEQHANTLRQQIIDWAKAETERLKTVDVNDLKTRVQEKLQNSDKYLQKIQNIKKANIGTVTTESLIYPKLRMTSNYWLALSYASQALETLEIMLKQKHRVKRNMSPSPNNNFEYIYETLNVKSLSVKRDLQAKIVNKVNSKQPEFEKINAKKVVINKRYMEPYQARVNNTKDENEVMTIKNLQIKGKLNEYLWNDLLNNTLKRKEEVQFLKAPIEIETLQTDSIVVSHDKINEQNLGALVSIDSGKYVINKDIQFDAPVTVNQLQIFERLNKLHVLNGKFDVLLKKSNNTQLIEGLKNVTNIRVTEPITVSGKMLGAQLEAMTPNNSITEPLVLQGNFVINGDVHINRQLNTLDLIDLKDEISMKQVLDMGIRMDGNLKDIKLKFLKPLAANNSLVSFINKSDLQRLVKLNQDDIQVIEGKKIFNESLEIRTGFGEVKNLNGIDIEKLENNAFLKNNNQTIKVPMKIGKISAKSIKSPIILLNSKNISDYLTTTGNQSIQGSLKVENLKTQYIVVEHLNSNHKIFHQNIQDIYQKKAHNASPADIFKNNSKFHGTIYVQNLILNSTINNKSVEMIENQILQLQGNIKYVGNFKFNYPINLMNMTFQGKLNDIPAEEFGKYWLQKKAAKQAFTAPQTVAGINTKNGLQLHGSLNGFTMEEFYTKTYWINRNEYIKCLNFESPLELTGYLMTKTLNGFMVPQDIWHQNSKINPKVLKSINVNENFIVDGNISILNDFNKIKLNKLQEFLEGSTGQTLYVENAHFSESPPLYRTLNGYSIRKTLDSVWLGNENVILPQRIEIADANFQGLLKFKGSINNINLDDLKNNYFSKTKSQDISAEIIFSKGVEGKNGININQLQLFGKLIDDKRNISFDFNEFVHNTLKTSGPHIITGYWSISEAIIEGNLNNVLINNLNLVNDTLLIDRGAQAVKAPKIFKNVYIENLNADLSTLVNNVPVAKWIKDAVYLYENYTIKGLTTIDAINVYNNLIVYGKLNNIKYSEDNLLLKNNIQHIPGSMKLFSYVDQEKRFLPNNMEHLYADYINQQHIPTFINNLIPFASTTSINWPLTFKSALYVNEYEGPELTFSKNYRTKRNAELNMNSDQATKIKLNEIKNYFINISKNQMYKLDHFDVVQSIEANSAEIMPFSLKLKDVIVDILTVYDKQFKNMTVFKWKSKENIYEKTNEFDWLPHDPLLLKIITQRYVTALPIDVENLEVFIRHDLAAFKSVLYSKNVSLHNYLEFLNETCIQFENTLSSFMELHTFCSNSQTAGSPIIFNANGKQVLSCGKKCISVLTNSSVLIYDISFQSPKILQKLQTPHPKEIASGFFKNYKFLAVLTSRQSSVLKYGIVEIYRSVNSSTFTTLQSLKCLKPIRIGFSYIKKSNDFLIHMITASPTKPYVIYKYNGVMGFKEILSDSTLPTDLNGFTLMNLLSCQQHLVALKGHNKSTLLEFVLN